MDDQNNPNPQQPGQPIPPAEPATQASQPAFAPQNPTLTPDTQTVPPTPVAPAQPAPEQPQQFGAPAGQAQPGFTPTNPADQPKDFLVALLLSIFVGSLGIDRFYLGYIGLGILKLVTLGGCGIWYLIDIILIVTHKLPDSKGRPLASNH